MRRAAIAPLQRSSWNVVFRTTAPRQKADQHRRLRLGRIAITDDCRWRLQRMDTRPGDAIDVAAIQQRRSATPFTEAANLPRRAAAVPPRPFLFRSAAGV